ncbi:MAG: type II toxin-antitoxin system mRNA interferase toxin, RelE/StbE family [Patescibacteria group bacterium]|nr:type II toxin-antitoxin system mRNA interferase toxin, RelE/StbE family [Patescibacteria group bacterium]
MRITSIELSSRYKRSFRRLHPRIQRKAVLKIKIFEANAFDPRLRTHPLFGKEKECWVFWIDYYYRIKFIFLDNDEVLFLDIGTHGIYT